MNAKRRLLTMAVLLLSTCEQKKDVSIPTFADGGLLRTGTPLTRAQLYGFEGMFQVEAGSGLLGEDASIRTSQGTVSILTDVNAGFSVLGAACLPDGRVVLEGYWQYPMRVEAGLVRLFVEPPELAQVLCDGEPVEPSTDLQLTGSYSDGNDTPTLPLTLRYAHELKPWRGRFFTVSHHGACEPTDYCGASPNSLESIRLSERTGSNAAEVDVRLTRDGIPILFHDPSLSSSLVRGVFCSGGIADVTLAELRANCLLRYGETIPTLDEALRMMIDETELEGVYLDEKTPDGVLPSARLIAKYDAELAARNSNDDATDDRRFTMLLAITNADVRDAWHDAKATLEREEIEVPQCLLEYDPELVIEDGCRAWGPTWTEGPQPDDVAKVRSAGARVVFWTINQSEFIDEFLKHSHPDGIISGRPALVFHRYQKIGTPPPLAEEP